MIRNVLDRVVVKIKTHLFFLFFRKSCRLWDNDEKFGRARGTTNDVTIWRIRLACWIDKTTCTIALAQTQARVHAHAHTHTHTQISNNFAFPRQKWLTNTHKFFKNVAPSWNVNLLAKKRIFSEVIVTCSGSNASWRAAKITKQSFSMSSLLTKVYRRSYTDVKLWYYLSAIHPSVF
jgi:hypothetical protein